MMAGDLAATPAPDQTRRGGSGPVGRADRTDEYVISVGDVLSADDPEPPAGTEVLLSDGSRWKHVPLYAREWPYAVLAVAMDQRIIVRSWAGITAGGSVTVVWLPSELPEDLLKEHRRLEAEAAAGAMNPDGPGQWRPVTWDVPGEES